MVRIDHNSPSWQQRILDALKTRVNASLAHPAAIPAEAGGWWHDYVCPEHALPLIFNTLSPHCHRCPRGEIVQGRDKDASHRLRAHRHYAALARDAAILYRMTNSHQYYSAALEILLRYADLYSNFDGFKDAQPWMLVGKAFTQALTEALWILPLVQAYDIVKPELPPYIAEQVENNLLSPVAEVLIQAQNKLVFQQGHIESNYNAWLIAALACIGFSTKNDQLVERAINSEAGFYAHLNAAILPDGFEYEGSPYYHNFVTLAYTLLAETAKKHDLDLYSVEGNRGQSIYKMWSALSIIALPDGSIPAFADGNYWQNANFYLELSEVYEIALARTNEPRYAWLLERIYASGEAHRDSWASLLYAKQDLSPSEKIGGGPVIFDHIGFAVIQDPAQNDGLAAVLRYGPYGGSHTHLDLLSIVIYPFSPDAGNPPYGADIRREWYQQSAAHNVVLVDGQSQAPVGGRLLSWMVEPGCCSAWAAADDAYLGVKYSRKVALEKGLLTDQTSLAAGEPHFFDWLLHTDVPLIFEDLALSPASGALLPESPSAFLRATAHGNCAGPLTAIIELQGQKYRLTLSSPDPLQVILARSPQRGGMDLGERFTLAARVHASQTSFIAVYEKI